MKKQDLSPQAAEAKKNSDQEETSEIIIEDEEKIEDSETKI